MPDEFGRRPRYRGKNPRQFHEKYKEFQPEKYAGDVARVIEAGKTPAGTHRAIMVAEILRVLAPRPGEMAVDCTLGYGGHASELLKAVQPGGKLFGIDADPIELPKTEARLRSLGFPEESIATHRSNFAGLRRWIDAVCPGGVDLILADLGVSSMQLDDPSRGFTFKSDAPLDMRMNPSKGQSAAEFLASIEESRLARLLDENSEEPLADEIASAIAKARVIKAIKTTRGLAEVIRVVMARARKQDTCDDAIRRVFQAIRIAVNEELVALDALLRDVPRVLKPGGRIAFLTFHSGEDRLVKQAFKAGFLDGTYAKIADEVIRASFEERRDNPRSSSAKLRFAVRADRPTKGLELSNFMPQVPSDAGR